MLRKRRKSKNKQNLEPILKRISRIIKIASRKCRNNYYIDSLDIVENDPKKCWKFIKNALSRYKKSDIALNDAQGQSIFSAQIKAYYFNNYFLETVANLKQQIEVYPGDTFNSLRTLTRSSHRFVLNNVNINDISEIISNIKYDKSPGHDNISPKFIKECRAELGSILVKVFNKIINSSEYPDILKVHKIVPIPKESNATTVNKFRPIAVLSTIGKIFEKLIYDRLLVYLEATNLLYDC